MSNTTTKPVRLRIDDALLTFATLRDFEFCLDARTEVPARKVADLLKQPVETLRREAKAIRDVEQRFMAVLTGDIQDRQALSRGMRLLDRQLFSQDYRWRSIVTALDESPEATDDFRRAVLVRYVQYLRSRQRALREAFEEHNRREQTKAPPEPPPNPEIPAALRETVIFDVDELIPREGGPQLEALPRGQPVNYRAAGRPMELHLSGHRFELATNAMPLVLLDSLGGRYLLRDGRNFVGRDLQNDVVIDAGFRDVSRRHLVIEPLDAHLIQFTDLSSHGTHIALVS